MKKLILVLSSVFLLTNVYSQTFEENLQKTISFMDSISSHCVGINKLPMEERKDLYFVAGQYDCLAVNNYGTFLLDGHCYIKDGSIEYITYKNGDMWMRGFDPEFHMTKNLQVVLTKRDYVYYIYMYNY